MYDFKKIEKKWQKLWEQKKPWNAKDFSKNKKYFSLVEFPYPSGEGLHLGHVRSYMGIDIIARKRRMEGYNVLNPIGWDAFGLPTEQYAIKTGIQPEEVTKKNTKKFRDQLKAMGFSFDWDREINTSNPSYYRWTQWIFLQLFKHGLAYKDTAYINWCPSCRIGLSNEEVVNGKCERCGGLVEKKVRKQWMLRITSYADKLIKGLEGVDYLDEIKTQQINWIGRSEGREIEFPLSFPRKRESIRVFTTRPDTIDGVTYIVLAPEHPLISELKIKNKKEVENYVNDARNKTDLERQEDKEKIGVELKGFKVTNPYNREKVPVWVADYVVMHYGTGAIMAVPAHDERDREFAVKYKLPIKNSPLVPKKKWLGEEKINYKLRDWVFSRQRYWGEPIPIIICPNCGFVPVPEEDLPVKLPKIKDYHPRDDGQSPLASAVKWTNVKCPNCKKPAKRETDTMPNWAGSSWYFLAYAAFNNLKLYAGNKSLEYWMSVDWYDGGMEHTTLHLLYSRFWNQFLYDIGISPSFEPYKKRTAHGLVLSETGEKMSKSKGNVINPDSLIKEFGADALRLYNAFIGPFRDNIPWDSRGIVGTSRFLNKIHNLIQKNINFKSEKKHTSVAELDKLFHQTIKKVSEDIEEMKFNTAVSSLMILVNKMDDISIKSAIPKSYFVDFTKLLFPFAPHISQEIWFLIGGKDLVDGESWPLWNEKIVADESFSLIIQVNGKVRSVIKVKKGLSQKEAESLSAKEKLVSRWLENKKIKKVIFITDKLINFIVN